MTMRRAVRRDVRELVDPKPLSDMYDAFSELGDSERFVIGSTLMTVEETTDAVVRLILDDELIAPSRSCDLGLAAADSWILLSGSRGGRMAAKGYPPGTAEG